MSQLENQNFLAPPPDAKAALFFLEGHYQFKWREGSVERTKFLSPKQIGRAFSDKDAFDSGWLDSRVVRFAQDSSGEICFGKNTASECRLDTIETIWRLILESPFSGDHAADRCRTHPGDARKFLYGLNRKKTFPKNALIKTNHTVGELWQAVR